MRKIIYAFLVTALLVSCSDKKEIKKTPEVNITSAVNPADGLDFKLVGALFQEGKVTDAESLEKELNREGGINNLDLDGDGKTDFINVSENKPEGNFRSFDLTTGDENETTFIGTVEVEKGSDNTYNIHMSGSESLYGPDAHYTVVHRPSIGEMMFYSWLFAPRPLFYHRPYYGGFYPHYYHPVAVVPRGAYAQRTVSQRTVTTKTVTKSKTPYKSKTTSANKGKTSTASKATLDKAKKAQTRSTASSQKGKSFTNKNTNNNYKGGGFSNKSKTTTTTKPKSTTGSSYKKSSSSSRSSGSSRSRSSGSRRRR